MKQPSQSRILIIGDDPELAYLIGRYAEQSGYAVVVRREAPAAGEVRGLQPSAILFSSVDRLESAPGLVAELASDEFPVLVCSSAADEAHARELGADHCLQHPLTFDGFLAVLAASSAAGAAGRHGHSWSTPQTGI